MIQLDITRTSKVAGSPTGEYAQYDSEVKRFKDLAEAKAWLKDEYGTCKRQPMYTDLKDGSSRKIGYIYCFKNADWSHSPVEHWYQQDWVEFSKVTYSRITL